MKIYILIFGYKINYSLQIDTIKNECVFCNENKNIDTKAFAKKLCEIVYTWRPNYFGRQTLDGVKFNIVITEGNLQKRYVGQNDFPANFNELTALIQEVEEC